MEPSLELRDELLGYWLKNMLRRGGDLIHSAMTLKAAFDYTTCNMLSKYDVNIKDNLDMESFTRSLYILEKPMIEAIKEAGYNSEETPYGNHKYRLEYRKKEEYQYYLICLKLIEKHMGIKIEPIKPRHPFSKRRIKK